MMSLSNKEKAVAFLAAIGTSDTRPLSFISRQFIQHDTDIADGLEGVESWLSQQPSSASVKPIRVLEDGDYVFIHSLYELNGSMAGADIFRFEGGEIVEHWDNFQEMEKPNPSGRTLLDGATEIADVDRTEQNKAVVQAFLTAHLVNGSNDIAEFFDGDTYIQHNSGIADGVSGLLAAGKAYAEKGIKAQFTGIHKLLGEGNFVLAVSEGRVGDNHISFYDFYRLQNGKIAEHWDILETIAPEGEHRNKNGKF